MSDYSKAPVPIRREMRDLEKNYPDQWNLYLLALSEFQAIDENEQLSYYQIAGEWVSSFTGFIHNVVDEVC